MDGNGVPCFSPMFGLGEVGLVKWRSGRSGRATSG